MSILRAEVLVFTAVASFVVEWPVAPLPTPSKKPSLLFVDNAGLPKLEKSCSWGYVGK